MKRFRVYMLATLPFLAVFAYWALTIIPSRPEISDPVHGYVFPLDIADGGPHHYASLSDVLVVSVTMAIALSIMVFGMWRSGAFRLRK